MNDTDTTTIQAPAPGFDPLSGPILVTGGTGKTGRRVADRLRASGIPVRIASRSTAPAFDWDDQTTWDPHLDGATAAYLAFAPDLAFPGAAETIEAFSIRAAELGVRRLVLLSGRGEERAQVSERGVQHVADEWTIVRCSWFMQNFSEHFLLGPVLDGVIALPAGNVAEPFVDVDDVADVVVAALVDGAHAGEVYELTGPRALTFADIATELSAATGRRIDYVPCSAADYVAAAVAAGVSDDEAESLADLFEQVLDGRNASTCDGVSRALGRPPRDFSAYVDATVATGVWTPGGAS